jgi:putative ABC transport system ATP-binding protein
VLADEPTGNLDTKSSKEVMTLLNQLNAKHHATILMVTHDSLAASFCNRIIFIKDGELVDEIKKEGTQKSFYQRITEKLGQIEGVMDEF